MGTAAPVTRSGRGAWNQALKELREVDATPEQIEAAAIDYRKRWPGIELTPPALAKHWHLFVSTAEPRVRLEDHAQHFTQNVGVHLSDEDWRFHLRYWEAQGLGIDELERLDTLRTTLLEQNQ